MPKFWVLSTLIPSIPRDTSRKFTTSEAFKLLDDLNGSITELADECGELAMKKAVRDSSSRHPVGIDLSEDSWRTFGSIVLGIPPHCFSSRLFQSSVGIGVLSPPHIDLSNSLRCVLCERVRHWCHGAVHLFSCWILAQSRLRVTR